MFTMRKFCALVFLSLMWVNLAWAANSYYVTPSSDGKTITYAVVTGTTEYNQSHWSDSAATGEGVVTTLPKLFYGLTQGNTSTETTVVAAGDVVYLKKNTYYTTIPIDIRKDVTIYGGFSGSESTIDERDLKTNITTIDGSGIHDPIKDSNNNMGGVALSPIFYINKHTYYKEARYQNDTYGIYPNTTGSAATVLIDGLTIANNPGTTYWGGGLRIEGGVVTIQNCVITGNKTVLKYGSTPKAGSGGGIYIEGKIYTAIDNCPTTKVTVKNCTITKNIGGNRGGGIQVGYSDNDPEVLIENCVITDNECNGTENGAIGGGINIESGKVEIKNCTIANNKAKKDNTSYATYGGGIGAWYPYAVTTSGAGHSLTITNCTIANNEASATATTHGGGLWLYTTNNGNGANVINCTITGNSANYGGAFAVQNVTFTNCIIANNTATTRPNAGSYTNTTQKLNNCAILLAENETLPSTITTNDNPVNLKAWNNPKTDTQEVNGVTHTIYRIEQNSDLSDVIGKGTPVDGNTTDQIGHAWNATPSIGAVENVNAPVLESTYTITATEGTPITDLVITPSAGEYLTWSISGVLPTGLTASSTDKTFTISGTPEIGTAKTDAYTYTLKATNSAGTATATINITIKAINPVLDMTGEITKTFTEGVKIDTITITATTGNDRLTWTADSSALPKGLTGTAATDNKSFTISGTPDTGSAGSYTYTVTATNVTGTTASATFKITVNSALALTASKTSISATEGTAIESITISSNSDESLTWTADASKLPDGLTGSAAKDGKSFTISGTPKTGTAKTEAYSYTVSAKNSAGETATASITITVSKAAAAAETAPVLDTSSVNVSVNEGNEIEAITITATAGTNLTWTTSGDLPENLTGTPASDKMSFTISGIPSNRTARIDAYTYKVTAANTAGSASAVITITVNSTGGINDEVSNALETLASTGESMTLEDALTGRLGLTTEQLKTVTSITIPDNITDLGDLSTLLPNLEAIDLTSATSLTEVNLKGNTSIKEVTITGNSNVKTLDLTDCSVETLDATGCDELTEVNIAGNTNIQTLSLDECPNIEGFNAEGCENLTNLSLSNKGSEGRRGKLSSLNLTGCKNLKELAFKGNMMKRFHVTDFSLNSLETLSAGDQAVGNVKLSKRFSFIDFFLNLLFNSNVSVSISNSHSKLTAVEVIIATASGDKNVKSVTAYDNSGVEIDGDYDSETGEAVFISTPARIEYDYDTGFDSEESMDVAISGESVEDESDMTLDNPGGSGGCNSSFASGALLALLGFVIARKKHNKDSEK